MVEYHKILKKFFQEYDNIVDQDLPLVQILGQLENLVENTRTVVSAVEAHEDIQSEQGTFNG